MLAPAMRHEPGVTANTLRDLVETDCGRLYAIMADGEMVGAYVLRVQAKETGMEGVVVAAGGKLPGHSLIRSVLPAIESYQLSGCDWVRIHTARRGMVRELSRHGYQIREIVMSKENHHGR